MADVLGKYNLFAVCENRSLSLNNRKKNLSTLSFSRCTSLWTEGLSFSQNNGFLGQDLEFKDQARIHLAGKGCAFSSKKNRICPEFMKWWKKGVKPNMKEIDSCLDLVDSISNAGDKLVIVEFFSPGCGGCRSLHPKICQFAEMNPDVMFLQVNQEEHRSMCYSLNVTLLPFFRFYRGAEGRLCSFSCTVATIKKFKDRLAKHTTERCSIGPTKGLEESELLALSENKDLEFTYTPNPNVDPPNPNVDPPNTNVDPPNTNVDLAELHPSPEHLSIRSSETLNQEENKKLVSSGR